MKVPQSNATSPSSSSNVSSLVNRGATPAGGSAANKPSGGAQDGDHVQVSTLSNYLNTLGMQSASQASRLVELSGVVSSGRYQVDAQVLSNKIIQEHMQTAA